MQKLFGIFALLLSAMLTACGGGGGSGGSNPNQLEFYSTAPSSLILPPSSSRQYEVRGGVPPYRTGTSDAAIAIGVVSGNVLTLGAVSPGSATVNVMDNSGASIPISLTVGSSIPLYTTAPDSLSIGVGAVAARTFTIGGGVAPYTVEGGDGTVASAQLVGTNQLKVTGIVIGSTAIKIRDAANQTVSLSVKVGAPELRVSPTDLKIFPGIDAVVKISGGQPPYHIAGGIPAAILAEIRNGDELYITGKLASTLEMSVADATGQLQKVTVTVEIGAATFGLSPQTLTISETDTQRINFTIFGAAAGSVCLFTSDTRVLMPTVSGCTTSRTVTLDTGTNGSRCVTGDQTVTVTAVDANRSVGMATVTIKDNGGVSCTAFAIVPATLTVRAANPTAVPPVTATTAQALISGGSGTYDIISSNTAAATATASGNAVTVTGGTVAGTATITVRDRADITRSATIVVTVN